jgi:2-polyprenyl-3-methyl-5-hydroxy-6-metoxy-1,4-benzoquinol methylase
MYKTTEIASAEMASDNPIHQRLFYPYFKVLEQIENANILEIGTGAGRGVEVLSAKAKHYTGIDKNTPLLAELKKNYPNYEFIDMFIPPLKGIANDSVDVIVTFQVIEHIEDDHLFLQEAHRVLKPGGKLFLTTPNRLMSLTRNPWHVREYLGMELKNLMLKYFKNVDAQGIHGNQKVNDYYEANKKAVKKITRFDILDLQYRLPRWLLQIPYDLANRISRNMLLKQNSGLTTGIDIADFHLSSDIDTCYDFYYVATK